MKTLKIMGVLLGACILASWVMVTYVEKNPLIVYAACSVLATAFLWSIFKLSSK